MVLWEAGIIGLLGSVLGIAAGLALAWMLSFVINVSFFGWTIAWATPWRFLLALAAGGDRRGAGGGLWPGPAGGAPRHRRWREDGVSLFHAGV